MVNLTRLSFGERPASFIMEVSINDVSDREMVGREEVIKNKDLT